MKKAFDLNVSRAKPRLRLGAVLAEVAPSETAFAQAVLSAPQPAPETPDLGAQVKARAEKARAPRPSAAETVKRALGGADAAADVQAQAEAPIAASAPRAEAPTAMRIDVAPTAASGPRVDPAAMGIESAPSAPRAEAPTAMRIEPAGAPGVAAMQAAAMQFDPAARTAARFDTGAQSPVGFGMPPSSEVEVQTPLAPVPGTEQQLSPEVRRERLKERLQAVRENPRPEPLPPTVAEAGVLAVERIATLQAELSKVKAVNLALTQDLESARRQSERATEEARLRMDEARRLSTEMEERARLLADLERELASLEGERDEALLSLQESRQTLEVNTKEREALKVEVARRDQSLADSLSEEERLAGELESAHDDAAALRRSLDALKTERDTLARQVGDLTIERADLLEARKALQAVHKALSHAVVR